jgi:hypothetical protein
MRIFNNTNKIQEVRVSDQYGKCYSVFIEANRYADFEGYQITKDIRDKIDAGILANLSNQFPPTPSIVVDTVKVQEIEPVPATVEETKEDTTTKESKEESEVVPSSDEVPPIEEKKTPDTYICEVCGNEYASPKSLERHMSKSHKE